MKRMSVVLSAFLAAGCVSFGAYASDTQVNVSFKPSSGMITLEGNAEGITSIMISKEGQSLADGVLPAYFRQISTNGEFVHTLYLAEGTDGGTYKVSIADDNGNAEADFIFFDINVAQKYIGELNEASDRSEFIQTASDNAMNLGVDTTDSEHSDRVFALMYDLDRTYDDPDEFYTMYTFCKAVCSFEDKSADEIKAVLQKNESVLGINYDDDFENNDMLTSKAKSKLCQMLASMDYADILQDASDITDKSGFISVYDSLCALSVANTTTSVGMQKLYTEECDFLIKNVVNRNKDYLKLSPTSVFVKMLDMSFDEPSDLKDNFDNAADEASADKKPSSNKGGGGGGGGKVVSAPSVNSGVYDDIPSDKQESETTTDDGNTAVQSRLSASIPTLSSQTATFADVGDNDWFCSAVSLLGGNNIINGDTNGAFRPNDNITRAEFAKLIVSAFSINGGEAQTFEDVDSDAWYAEYVSKAAASGVVTGYIGCFNPDLYISRQDAAVMIYRVSSLVGKAYTGFEAPDDMDSAALYAYTAIGTLYRNGIIKGNGNGEFVPLSNITRAEAAQLLYNTISDLERR